MSAVPPSRPSLSEQGKLPRLGRYALVTQTSTGVLGPRWVAYVVDGPDQGRVVAVRRIPVGQEPRTATRLSNASRHSESVRHPRVLAVLESVRGEGELAVASEHIQGEVLSLLLRLAVLRQSPIPPPVALAIVRDLTEGLLSVDEAWRKVVPAVSDPLHNAAHGGVSPDSVLVAAFGEALLVDPGLTGAAAVLTDFRRHPFAVPYRAPEQLAMLGAADERSDVFSLGVMLWEMLANRALFGGADRLKHADATALDVDTAKVAEEIRARSAPDLATVQRPGAPIRVEVRQLVARALSREPAARHGSLRELAAALQGLPGESIGSPEQVASTVDRLARSLMDARKAAIEGTAGGLLVDSMPPPSDCATDRPAPPSHPITVLMPADLVPPKPMEVSRPSGGFDIGELSTAAGLRKLAELPPSTLRIVGPQPSPPPELTVEESDEDQLLVPLFSRGQPSPEVPSSEVPSSSPPTLPLGGSPGPLGTADLAASLLGGSSPSGGLGATAAALGRAPSLDVPAAELGLRPSRAPGGGRRLGIGVALGLGLLVAAGLVAVALTRSRPEPGSEATGERPDAGAVLAAPSPSLRASRAEEQEAQAGAGKPTGEDAGSLAAGEDDPGQPGAPSQADAPSAAAPGAIDARPGTAPRTKAFRPSGI